MRDIDLSGPVPADRDERRRWLVAALAREGEVRQVAAGRYEVSVEPRDRPGPAYPPVITVVVADDQWSQLLDDGIDPPLYVGELLASRDPEERYVVHHDRDLWMSVREELPPVRGSAMLSWLAEVKAQVEADGGELGLHAYPTRADGGPGREH